MMAMLTIFSPGLRLLNIYVPEELLRYLEIPVTKIFQ